MYILLIALLIVMLDHSVSASPAPGDIFREYVWKGPWITAGNWQRVTDPDASHSGASEFLPNPVNRITLDDLQGAVRVEMVIEQWGGHAGTSDKRLRLNGGDWLPIPEPGEIPGDTGLHERPECYQYFVYPVVPLPLEQLMEGENSFEFTCGGQICFDFGWGQWGVYGIILRIYYDDSKPHATGRIVSPGRGASFGDSLHIRLESADPTVRQVDFIGLYEDFDYEGNGIYRQWHYNFRYGAIKRHLGSAAEAPFAVTWDASSVPDQEEEVQIMARVLDENGIYCMTEPVGDLRLARTDRSVRLYEPFDVPGSWQTRAGRRHKCKVFVPNDLRRATSARMLLTTWCGSHADAIGVNETTVVPRVGRDHDYSYDEVNVPLACLRPGKNEFFTFSNTVHHGIEVFWPGIALKVQYEGVVETASLVGEERIYADDLGEDWRTEPDQSHELYATEIDLNDRTMAYRGGHAVGLESLGRYWELNLVRRMPVEIVGRRILRFAFHPGAAVMSGSSWFKLSVNGEETLVLTSPEGPLIDMERREWQMVEVPLDPLGFRFPYLESLRLYGYFTGRFYLDEIRIEPYAATAVTEDAAIPKALRLEQNFPNPFNGETTIRFSLPAPTEIDLGIYDLVGQRLVTLERGPCAPGLHALRWDGRNGRGERLASGVYVYRLTVGDHEETRKLLLLR